LALVEDIVMRYSDGIKLRFTARHRACIDFSRAYTFDLVSMFDVLEHMSEGYDLNALSEANKALKTNGYS
jgi:hypothetical protein